MYSMLLLFFFFLLFKYVITLFQISIKHINPKLLLNKNFISYIIL